ncbi:MAG: hypothetical protein EA391_00985 [Balneolaceae bacterium]|nr:MAG: hypothetical protein EA391_00985 [Balneolaceae bacterium]
MPGHERQKLERPDFVMYTPHQYLHRTFWDIDKDWFYFLTTDNSTIYRVHLETGEEQVISTLNLEKRVNSKAFAELLIATYSDTGNDDEYWAVLNKIDFLPLFASFIVETNIIYLTLLPTPGIEGITLVIDIETEEVKYFSHPQEFVPKAICGNTVYGIDYRVDESYQIVQLEFQDE